LKRREARWALLCAAASLLSACAGSGSGKLGNPPSVSGIDRAGRGQGSAVANSYKIGAPYQINGVWYYPQLDPHYNAVGTASWYGEAFHGRYTANGELYDMNALTAAHTTLPLPSTVEVTNLENGRVLVLRVNDRGPFINGRLIDVSRRAAQLLGFEQKGTTMVRVRVMPDAGGTMLASAEPSVHAQIVIAPMPSDNTVPLASPAQGSASAAALSESSPPVQAAAVAPIAQVASAPIADLSPAPPKRMAAAFSTPRERLADEAGTWDGETAPPRRSASVSESGEQAFGSLMSREPAERVVRARQPWAERPTLEHGAKPVQVAAAEPFPSARSMRFGTQAAAPAKLVWTVGLQPVAARPVVSTAPAARAGHAEGDQGVYIQAGAFADSGKAQHLRAELASFGPTDVTTASVGGRVFHRVRIGPLSNADSVDLALAKLRRMGHPEARIVAQ
jgi:rare lipoprotein A